MLGLTVVLIFFAVMFWRLFRQGKVIKLDLDIYPGSLGSLWVDEKSVQPNPIQFVLRGKNLNIDWDRDLLAWISRGEKFATTFQFLNRKLTVVVESDNEIIERGVAGRILLTFIDPDNRFDFWLGLQGSELLNLLARTKLTTCEPVSADA